MAQMTYRGNLSAKVFPFLSTLLGRTVISQGQDHAGAYGQGQGESAGGDDNIPQAYYLHNVMPAAQGYKSVGYTDIVPPIGISFDRVLNVRDPDMTRGLLGITTNGFIFIHKDGDATWTDITYAAFGWSGGDVSVAYAEGTTYICLSEFAVYKVDVANRKLIPVVLEGLQVNKIVAITASANYMIVTDGVKLYWSSTLTAEDFTPSQITGAGSGTPTDVRGQIVTLVPIAGGFVIYTEVNAVVAAYSQNARFPWVFKGVDNSKGVADTTQVTYNLDDSVNYAWTTAGLQRITGTAASTVLSEVTDFLAGRKFEDFDSINNKLIQTLLTSAFKIRLAFVGARFLLISYGVTELTHVLVYDLGLKRWGKLRFNHVACIDANVGAKKTIGLVRSDGSIAVCNFDEGGVSNDSVLILGKFQLLRSRTVTLDSIVTETVEDNSNFEVIVGTSFDGKNIDLITKPTLAQNHSGFRQHNCRVTGLNHSVIFKGSFHINSYELVMHLNGKR